MFRTYVSLSSVTCSLRKRSNTSFSAENACVLIWRLTFTEDDAYQPDPFLHRVPHNDSTAINIDSIISNFTSGWYIGPRREWSWTYELHVDTAMFL